MAVHTVPVWQDEDGTIRYGLGEEPEHPPVVGWANLIEVEIEGERVLLLATVPGDE